MSDKSINQSDTAYIESNPNCIGEYFTNFRGEIFTHINEIARDMGTIASAAQGNSGPRKLHGGEWYQNVVSIFGERGSGKTVLLLSACACLRKERKEEDDNKSINQKVPGDILLPVIQPEFFEAEDTLITWVLTRLKEYIEDDKPLKNLKINVPYGDNDETNEEEVLDFIKQMRKDEALFSRKFSQNLANQDVTAADFSAETIAVVDAQARFLSDWRRLINKLIVGDDKERTRSKSTDRQKHPFLFIPIDDADLNPQALPGILRQLQLLQHPNVCILFSVHKESLHAMMYIQALERHTNADNARPVVNYNTLIKREMRDTENVRASAWAKLEKFLPHKYRVGIKQLTPKARLEFKPLIEVKEEPTDTFLDLLKKVPTNIFGNKRYSTVAEFFDLTQMFELCFRSSNSSSQGKCDSCSLQADCCYNSYLGIGKERIKEELKEAEKNNDKEQIRKCTEALVLLPSPSRYVDMLPGNPRSMDAVYKLLLQRTNELVRIEKECKEECKEYIEKEENEKIEYKGKADDERKENKKKHEQKLVEKLRKPVAEAMRDIINLCLGFIPSLPIEFRKRIQFTENRDEWSKHPIQVEFDTNDLTNRITEGEHLQINAFRTEKGSRILSISPIREMTMDVAEHNRIIPTRDMVWKFSRYVTAPYETQYGKRDDGKSIDAAYYVPKGYWAAYNLTYDITSHNGIFGRTQDKNEYKMRDEAEAVKIFSVRTGTSTLFDDCYCAIPRWHRMAAYNLFSMAWNNLVKNTADTIMYRLDNMPNHHEIADWVVLSLLRIHICIGMNYVPFMGSEDEAKIVYEYAKLKKDNDGKTENVQKYEAWKELSNEDKKEKLWKEIKNTCEFKYLNLIDMMKRFVKKGLCSVMKHIKKEGFQRALPKHHQAFKTWVEYGLPMLSNGDYVSKELGVDCQSVDCVAD